MLLIPCPYCGESRPETEFENAGQAHIVRPKDMDKMTDEEFEFMFFIRSNPKGLYLERWRHTSGCGRFFNVVRHTLSDQFLKSYKAGESKPTKKELESLLKDIES